MCWYAWRKRKKFRETLMIKKFWSLESLICKTQEQINKDIFVEFTFSGKIPFLCHYVEFLALGFNGYIDILWMYEGPWALGTLSETQMKSSCQTLVFLVLSLGVRRTLKLNHSRLNLGNIILLQSCYLEQKTVFLFYMREETFPRISFEEGVHRASGFVFISLQSCSPAAICSQIKVSLEGVFKLLLLNP